MAKLKPPKFISRYTEYEIEFKGTALVPFRIKMNQLGLSMEQAIRIAKKTLKSKPLDLLSPKVISGEAKVHAIKASQAVPPDVSQQAKWN